LLDGVAMIATPLIEIRDLNARFRERRQGGARWIRAVDGVSIDIYPGETLGLVGESGCGKTTLGRTVLALQRPSTGSVRFAGRPVFGTSAAARKALHRQMQLVFQDPFASLDPRKPVGRAVRAGLDIHGVGTLREREAAVAEMFKLVGLDPQVMDRYPHEFSGGQRQRIVIARALILRPRFLVCDEPVSALDVSIQAQILNLLKDLQGTLGVTYLFISHNLAAIEHMADRVAVMYFGRIVEIASRDRLFASPRHPYTRALIAAIPKPDPRQRLVGLQTLGDPPDPSDLPTGCRFRTRCSLATARCASDDPQLVAVDSVQSVACWNAIS
jgi:peptide/nickel transport system ATP-binding protein/oligopeptide transport system ATP-binding protein